MAMPPVVHQTGERTIRGAAKIGAQSIFMRTRKRDVRAAAHVRTETRR